MPSTRKPAKKVAVSSAACDVSPAKPIEPTTGTASTNRNEMARKRCHCSHQHSDSAPTVPPTCRAVAASAAVAGGSLAAVNSVGVQPDRKK
jgi:hypothetical protein